MFFYLLHNLMNFLYEDWKESKKNCFTLFFGANLHFFFFVFLEYCGRFSNNPFFELFRRFYVIFIVIDMFVMAVIYKLYWGRTIVAEIAPDNSGWNYDEASHQYSRPVLRTSQSELRSSGPVVDYRPYRSGSRGSTQDPELDPESEIDPDSDSETCPESDSETGPDSDSSVSKDQTELPSALDFPPSFLDKPIIHLPDKAK